MSILSHQEVASLRARLAACIAADSTAAAAEYGQLYGESDQPRSKAPTAHQQQQQRGQGEHAATQQQQLGTAHLSEALSTTEQWAQQAEVQAEVLRLRHRIEALRKRRDELEALEAAASQQMQRR